jgi:hypothetical protein
VATCGTTTPVIKVGSSRQPASVKAKKEKEKEKEKIIINCISTIIITYSICKINWISS